jgi:hypothetical protein
MFLQTQRKTIKRECPMDVTNSEYLELDYEDDVTPEAVAMLRRRAEEKLAGETFRLVVDGKQVGPELTYGQVLSGAFGENGE